MTKRRASVVFDHFVVPDTAEEVCRVQCKHCGVDMSFNRRATSNLLNHMKRKHAYIPLELASSPAKPSPPPQPLTSLTPPPIKKWQDSDPRQAQADMALIRLFAGELLPPSLADSPLLRAFLQELQPAYSPPGHPTLLKALGQQLSQLLPQVRALVHSAPRVCLTASLGRGRYVAVAGHAVVDFTPRTVMLGCRRTGRVGDKRATPGLLQFCHQIVEDYDLAGKVACILIDLAPEAQHHATLPGFEGSASDNGWGEEEGKLEDGKGVLGLQPCFARALHLVVTDALQAVAQAAAPSIGRAASIGTLLQSTTTAPELRHDPPTHTVPSLWSSQLRVIRMVLAMAESSGSTPPPLEPGDQQLLEELVGLLSPFEELQERVRGGGMRTVPGTAPVPASLVIPSIQGLHRHLGSAFESGPGPGPGLGLAPALRSAVERRLSGFERSADYQRATLLDPRLKLRCWEGELGDQSSKVAQVDQVAQLREDLLSLASTVHTDSPAPCPPKPLPSPSSPCSPKRSCLFPFFQDDPPVSPSPHSQEVESYLGEACLPYSQDPLAYWRSSRQRYPRLAHLAQHYLCIPACPQPSCALPAPPVPSDCELDMLAFIRCNNRLL